ncbi:MAG: hypothetical protein ISR77_39915 [Pirellulaceae bacterium]|nr:hypothetical protein [Pirellulaceae bacterium]
MAESKPKRRWYHLSPDRLIFGLLAVEGFLLLSEWFQWFAFNEKKGWTVLIAVAAVCLVVVVMLLWLVVSLLFRWRFQFSLRSLVVLVVAVAIPCCWLAVQIREAERQRRAVEAIRETGGWAWVGYDYEFDRFGNFPPSQEQEPAPSWLRDLLGVDFFAEVEVVLLDDTDFGDAGLQQVVGGLTNLQCLSLSKTQVTDAGLEHLKGLTNLNGLALNDTQITDEGLAHLKGFVRLQYLYLGNTQVTDKGIEGIRTALPNCEILESPIVRSTWDSDAFP